MKARSNLAITLLMAASCCVSSVYCADNPIPNRQKRLNMQHEYQELIEKNKTEITDAERIVNFEQAASLAEKLKNAETLLAHNDNASWREKKIREWGVSSLTAQNHIILLKLKDADLPKDDKIALLKRQHEITHTLKELYTAEKEANPHNSEATALAQQFMQQSLLLGQYESLIPKPSKPETISFTTIPENKSTESKSSELETISSKIIIQTETPEKNNCTIL